ncbi:MAG: pyrroline-5-carboxylate reductase [Candidatus Omnitrophota bacterium]|nr:pyrroline-5-carboxylate reductase [Candidatus Omnitrophota bacterium]
MKENIRVGIIGFGNMGAIFAEALNKQKNQVYVYDKDKKKTSGIRKFKVIENSNELINKVDVVILAIKPQDIKLFLTTTKDVLSQSLPLLITIAAGVSTEYFQKHIKGLKVIRCMPNLAAKVGQSLSFICRGKFAKRQDSTLAAGLLSSVGQVIEIKEADIDKVTSITGSGPGYIFYFMDCLYRSALKLGFSKKIAKVMVTQTFFGTASLVRSQSDDFKVWVDKVASSGGTTEAGIEVWKKNDLPGLVDKAVNAAFSRAKRLRVG